MDGASERCAGLRKKQIPYWSDWTAKTPLPQCCILTAIHHLQASEVVRMESIPAMVVVLIVCALIILLITVLKTLYTVRTASAGVVERFGKFNRITRPGLHCLIPFAEHVYLVDLQVKQAQFQV